MPRQVRSLSQFFGKRCDGSFEPQLIANFNSAGSVSMTRFYLVRAWRDGTGGSTPPSRNVRRRNLDDDQAVLADNVQYQQEMGHGDRELESDGVSAHHHVR